MQEKKSKKPPKRVTMRVNLDQADFWRLERLAEGKPHGWKTHLMRRAILGVMDAIEDKAKSVHDTSGVFKGGD